MEQLAKNESEVISDKNVKIKAFFTGSNVIVWNIDDGTKLFKLGYFGKPIGVKKPKTSVLDKPLELALIEALYLLKKNIIEVIHDNKSLTVDQFKNLINLVSFHLFDDLFIVYNDLREKNYILKPGLKFGSDFSVYKKGPGIDHAPFLIKVIPRGSKIYPIDLVSAGRLANSVKKRYLMASVISDKEIRYHEFKWTKP